MCEAPPIEFTDALQDPCCRQIDNIVVAVLLVLHVFDGSSVVSCMGQAAHNLLSASPPNAEELARRDYLLLFTYACGRTQFAR